MDVYIGVILQFASGWCPDEFVLCDGRSLSIQNHEALFSLIGTYYGGDGIHVFNVPDFRPRDEKGNVITNPMIGQIYNGSVYVPSFICVNGIYPARP